MFNFFVSWEEDAFESRAWVIERFRFTEYTEEKLARRYSKLTPKGRQILFSIPTLFVREGLKGDARVGYISNVRPRGNDLLIEFDFDLSISPFPADRITKRAITRLDIRSGELGRTHWAVKDEDLLAVLTTEGLIAAAPHAPGIPHALDAEPAVSVGDPEAVAPRVFVSYSWEGDDHKHWVHALATRLRSDGVNAILDQWNLRPGSDKNLFMERSVVDSDLVLIVGTPTYARKANERTGGVGYEAMIITGQLAQQISQEKFIPILKAGTWETSTPVWLQTKVGVDLSATPYAQGTYDDLLRRIHNEWHPAPQIGLRPTFAQAAPDTSPLSLTHEITDASPEGSTLNISTNREVTIRRIEYLTEDDVRVSQQALSLHGKVLAIALPHAELLKVWSLAPQDGTTIVFRIQFQAGTGTKSVDVPCVMQTDFLRRAGGLTLVFNLKG